MFTSATVGPFREKKLRETEGTNYTFIEYPVTSEITNS
jgi:hypothetical protein